MNSSSHGFPRSSSRSSQLGHSTKLGLENFSLQHGQKPFKLEQSLSLPCLFSSLSDCCPSLPDVQSFEKCCFICFVLFFSYFWWEGKSGLCYSILAGSPAATFEALSHQSTLNFSEGAGPSSSSYLAGIGFLVHTVPKTILPTTSFSLPTPYLFIPSLSVRSGRILATSFGQFSLKICFFIWFPTLVCCIYFTGMSQW